MKLFKPIVALLLSLVLLASLLPSRAFALSISDSGFTKIGSIPNDYVATQGMCTDGKYIYTFKMPTGNNNLARFYQTNIATGKTELMKVTYDTSLTNFLALGHGNDMCAVVHKGVTYLYLSTMYNRSHSSFATHSLWKFKVTGNTIEKVAYYDVIEYGTDDMDFTGLTVYKQTEESVTLLSSDGKYIYTIEIGHDQPSGTVDCKYVFTINYMTPPTPTGAPTYRYKDSSGNSYYGVQGMTYDNGKLYYVLTGSQTSATAKDNYIFCYDIENIPNIKSVEAIADESIFITSSYYQFFLEFESIDIHDGVMYFSANAGKYGYYEDYDFCGKLKKTFAVTPEYTVTFCDEAGATLQAVKVKEGETAKYTAATPTKAYDDANHYTFKEWLSSVGGTAASLSNVKGDLKVYAGFTADPHSYSETVTAQPSCTAEGSKTLSCTCGRSYTESIPVTEHVPTVINAKEPTCTARGYTGDTVCTVCHNTLATGAVIDPLPHSPVLDQGYAPTCSAAGLSDGSHCGVCGTVLEKQSVIPAVPHSTKILPGKEPTCVSSGLSDGLVCVNCGVTVKQQEILPRLGHSYTYVNAGETHTGTCSRCAKITTAVHNYQDGSCICGASLAPEVTVDEAIVIRHSLNLAGDISINYVVPHDLLEAYDSYYLECEIPVFENNVQVGTHTEVLQAVSMGSYDYFILDGLDAVSMTHKVKATVHMSKDGKDFVSTEDIYSIADYAYTQLNKDSTAESLKILCANLLRYGSLTQQYKNYCTNDLADGSFTDAHRSLLTDLNSVSFETVNRTLEDLAEPKVTWAGKSLILDSKVTLRFVFSASSYDGDPTELCLRVTYTDTYGETITATVSDPTLYDPGASRYAFDFNGLLAAELRSTVSVAIYEGDTRVSPTMEYSASSYGNGKPADLQTVCKALMAYSDAAKAYFAQ